jgi:polyisoprenoid-binding protein YceI
MIALSPLFFQGILSWIVRAPARAELEKTVALGDMKKKDILPAVVVMSVHHLLPSMSEAVRAREVRRVDSAWRNSSMKLVHSFSFFAATTALLAFPLIADAKLTRSGDPSVSFTAIGPGGLKIVGTTSELNVVDDAQSVSVVVPLSNLSTGIALRDRHMREKYLQVQSYPTATLKVDRASVKFPAAGAEATGDAQGTMTIHGQSHGVTFHYAAKREGAGYAVNGTVHVSMKDYGIEVPSYLGVTVKPDVDVTVRFVANDG